MSDHDAPHSIDRTFADAEALLDDEAARRVRRARVLEAVAQEAAPVTTPAPPRKPTAMRYVGWLTAASVVGLGGLVTYQLSPTAHVAPVATPDAVYSGPAPAAPTIPPAVVDAQIPEPAPSRAQLATPEERAPQAVESAPPPAPAAPPPAAPPPPAPPPPPPPPVAPPPLAVAAPPPPPPAAFPASQDRVESAEARRSAAPAPMAAQAPMARAQAAPASLAGLGARLRAAAAAGRTGEIAELLAEGAPVDARDNEGETALMKSIRANQPATAALLRRRGANPDLESRAGVSARDLAEAAGNPALERALAPDR